MSVYQDVMSHFSLCDPDINLSKSESISQPVNTEQILEPKNSLKRSLWSPCFIPFTTPAQGQDRNGMNGK